MGTKQEVALPFCKMHGTGNDFVIIDDLGNQYCEQDLNYKLLANRKIGIGCDQVILIKPSTKATCKMIIYNVDGSKAEMCGNAARCVVHYVLSKLHTEVATLELENSRLVHGVCISKEHVKVNMGKPLLNWDQIPTLEPCNTLNIPLKIGPLDSGVAVSMGNPHVIFFVQDIASVPFEEIAPIIENHKFFPNRTNVSIAQIMSENEIAVRIWERGVGFTESCGSAACSTLVAAVRKGYIPKKSVTIKLPGGNLFVEWDENGDVYMSGEVCYVFEGTMKIN